MYYIAILHCYFNAYLQVSSNESNNIYSPGSMHWVSTKVYKYFPQMISDDELINHNAAFASEAVIIIILTCLTYIFVNDQMIHLISTFIEKTNDLGR